MGGIANGGLEVSGSVARGDNIGRGGDTLFVVEVLALLMLVPVIALLPLNKPVEVALNVRRAEGTEATL